MIRDVSDDTDGWRQRFAHRLRLWFR
jgi:hypothetical protein